MAANSSTENTGAPTQPPIVIKKYANRRLYNTSSSSYVTLEELANLLRAGREFVVFDAKSGEDITRSVLTQIILEEDSKGRNLLPTAFLRQLIGFYDETMQPLLPRYLEMTMEHFIQNQEQMQRYFEGTMSRFFPVNQLNDMTRQNMALFQQATSMLSPFAASKTASQDSPKVPETKGTGADVEALRMEIARLEGELERMLAERASPPARKTSGADF